MKQLHSCIEQKINQGEGYYFSKSPPVRLTKGILHFSFTIENKPSLAYKKLFLVFPSVFILDRVYNTISVDIRQMPVEYEFYFRKLYIKGDSKFVQKVVYCLNPSLGSCEIIGIINEERQMRIRETLKRRGFNQKENFFHCIDANETPEVINFIYEIMYENEFSTEHIEFELLHIREIIKTLKSDIDELKSDTNELFKYNELVKKEFKKIDSFIQSIEKNRNKQLQTRIKKPFRLPFSKK